MVKTADWKEPRKSDLELGLRKAEPKQSPLPGARIHRRFAQLHRRHYGTEYPRTQAEDAHVLQRLVEEYGRNEAYYFVARAFREPLLAHFGITNLAMILTWAPSLARPADSTGSRVPHLWRPQLRTRIADRGEKSLIHAGRLQ